MLSVLERQQAISRVFVWLFLLPCYNTRQGKALVNKWHIHKENARLYREHRIILSITVCEVNTYFATWSHMLTANKKCFARQFCEMLVDSSTHLQLLNTHWTDHPLHHSTHTSTQCFSTALSFSPLQPICFWSGSCSPQFQILLQLWFAY